MQEHAQKFVMHLTLTPFGAENVERLPDVMSGIETQAVELGGSVDTAYFLMGAYDAVVTVAFSDIDLALALSARIAKDRYFTVTTSPAWDARGYEVSIKR